MFHELFSKALDQMGWSQNDIAAQFHINRGTQYKYRNGQLLPPRESFRQILNEMKLSAAARQVLCEAYYQELYGAEKLARIHYIESAMNRLDEWITMHPQPLKPLADSIAAPAQEAGSAWLSSQEELAGAVQWVFQQSSPGEAVTNYPYSCHAIDDVVFRHVVFGSGFRLTHLLTFDKGCAGVHNLENIFRSMRWLARQVNPICRYAHLHTDSLTPFPCFFALDGWCLLFHPQRGEGVLLRDEGLFGYLRGLAERFARGGFPLAVFPQDMFALQAEVNRASIHRVEANLSAYPCLAPIADDAFIRSVIREEVPGWEYLVQLGVEHYSRLMSLTDELYVTTAEGLRRFAQTGAVREIPGAFVKAAPFAERIRYFHTMIERIPQKKLFILDDMAFTLADKVSIDFFENIVMIAGYFEGIDSALQGKENYIVSVVDKELRQDFTDFMEYLQDNCYFYSEDAAAAYLKSMILLCEQLSAAGRKDAGEARDLQ